MPVGLFLAQISQESGWNPKARSPAGAIGIAQIVPRWHPGVNPNDPVASLKYAARLMASHYKKYGTWKDALSAYNSGRPWEVGQGISETNNYVKTILGKAGDVKVPKGAGKLSTGKVGDFSAGELGMTDQAVLGGVQALAAGNWDPMAQLDDLVAASQSPGMASGGRRGRSSAPGALNLGSGKGKVKIAPGADRSGVSTHGPVLKFASRVAGVFGGPLTVTTGTNHSQMTVNGNVSAHWGGNAVDIAASGRRLRRMGLSALVAAGVSRKKARQMAKAGGLYNIGPWQIIFRTNEGGNHWDHLHIGYGG